MASERVAVYPGTFDPVTYGHIDLIRRATEIFEHVIVAVVRHPQKKTLFSFKERIAMLKIATKGIPRITIEGFEGLLVNYVRRKKARVMVRGLRMISDFEYEFQMALTNRKLDPEIETIFMMPKESYCYLSSKLIKEVASLGANLKGFVPDFVERKLKKTLNKRSK